MQGFKKIVAFLLSVRRGFRIFFVLAYVGWVVALSLLPPQDLPPIPLFEGEPVTMFSNGEISAEYFGKDGEWL